MLMVDDLPLVYVLLGEGGCCLFCDSLYGKTKSSTIIILSCLELFSLFFATKPRQLKM